MSPSPSPTVDQLVTAAVAAKAALATAEKATSAARAPWDAATAACGITRARPQRGKHGTPPTPAPAPPTTVPSPLPDFAGLGAALTAAIIAENVARAAYTGAKQALAKATAGT